MPKTSAERKKEQMQRLKDSGGYEEFKKKERERRKEMRKKEKSSANAEQAEMLRKKKREEIRRYREKKRMREALTAGIETEEEEPETPSKVFKSRSACGKAVSRVKKNLPLSPKRREAVITKIAQQIVPHILTPERKREKKRSDGISEEIIDKIIQFYVRDDISRQNPGMKDVITIRHKDGSKQKFQTRHLCNSVKETHALFLEEHGSIVGKSKFAELRPKHVLLSGQQPHNVCLCKYHENFMLAVNALAKNVPSFPEYTPKFITSFLCEDLTECCWMSRCDQCRGKIKITIDEVTAGKSDTNVKWKTWKEEQGRLRIVEEDGTLQALINHVMHQVPAFKEHCFIKRMQAQSYQCDRENAIKLLEENSALLQIDFSENYTCIAQNEIQSYHWGQPQVSLFTASLWYNSEQHPIVIVSDSLIHTKDTVVPYLDRLLEELPDSVNKIRIWSDGPNSQFKNRYIAAALPCLQLHHNISIEWNYFATSHGKGPVDGIGGSLKRQVRSSVLRGEHIVANAHDFLVAAEKNSKIKVILMNEEDFNGRNDRLCMKEIFDNAVPIKDISKKHKIYQDHSGKVVALFLSAYVSTDYTKSNEDQERPGCSNATAASIYPADSTPSITTIKNGTYVIVKYENSNKKAQSPDYYTYAGICQSSVDEEGDVKIMSMKVSENNMFRVDENDVSFVQFKKIQQILPNPSLVLKGNRILYKFSGKVEVFEKP